MSLTLIKLTLKNKCKYTQNTNTLIFSWEEKISSLRFNKSASTENHRRQFLNLYEMRENLILKLLLLLLSLIHNG